MRIRDLEPRFKAFDNDGLCYIRCARSQGQQYGNELQPQVVKSEGYTLLRLNIVSSKHPHRPQLNHSMERIMHPVATTNYMGPWKHTRHFRVYTAVSPGSTKDLLSALTSTNRIEVVLIT
ncbi:uncharacterized protein UV8b_02347 [Ustilaginoidea virens]|uniref:Uncharacterized protein n=1 Tax=Ustilaginoidea virens TaxID=1159556 RepID=A0A8E5MFL8_USTVR|nr:uncharacterized protein UV8b_02347 [Ustilaginoidea virens]QUC18106.1 hypothetical protein UV8b_02347 [Ustilaginoidea virens]